MTEEIPAGIGKLAEVACELGKTCCQWALLIEAGGMLIDAQLAGSQGQVEQAGKLRDEAGVVLLGVEESIKGMA